MGNDGGSIPTRRELVKEAARNPTTTEIKATQTESQAYYWTHDPLTRAVLQSPVVSDSNGKLYNKASIIEFLLPTDDKDELIRREEAEKVLRGSVKSLKDVVEVKFDLEKEAKDGQSESWKCPITASPLGPGSKAAYLVPCGHAFSGAAIKEVAVEGSTCLVCDQSYAQNDVIPILTIKEEEIARLQLRAKTLREKGLAHSLKKLAKDKSSKKDGGGKKRKNRSEEEVRDEAPALVTAKPSAGNGAAPAKSANGASSRSGTATPSSSSAAAAAADSIIRNSSTASLTAKVMAEQESNKKRRMENQNLKSIFSNRDPSKPHGRSSDFMTRGFDIPAGAKR